MSQQSCVHTVSSWIIYAPLNICGLYSKLAGVYIIKVSKMLNTIITLKAKTRPWSWWFTELQGGFSSVLNASACRPSAKRHRICGFLMKHSHRLTSFLFSLHSPPKCLFYLLLLPLMCLTVKVSILCTGRNRKDKQQQGHVRQMRLDSQEFMQLILWKAEFVLMVLLIGDSSTHEPPFLAQPVAHSLSQWIALAPCFRYWTCFDWYQEVMHTQEVLLLSKPASSHVF